MYNIILLLKKILITFFLLLVCCNKNNNINNIDDTPVVNYFNVTISQTGESTLFIFQDTISTLLVGDQIGLYDENGIDENGVNGNVLVGSGTWDGSQLEIVAINSVDLTDLGGPLLPGAINQPQNIATIKIWRNSENKLYNNISGNIIAGSGHFNGLFNTYSELTIQE